MSPKFSFQSILLATCSIGVLLSCGGSGSGASSDEIPYVLPNGTIITVSLGPPQSGTIKEENAPEEPMTPEQLEAILWNTRTFSLEVLSPGIGKWLIFGQQAGSQFAYSRLSPTSFSLSVSWFGGTMTFNECQLPKISSMYGTVLSWKSASTDFTNTTTTIYGGGTAEDLLQYERTGPSSDTGTLAN